MLIIKYLVINTRKKQIPLWRRGLREILGLFSFLRKGDKPFIPKYERCPLCGSDIYNNACVNEFCELYHGFYEFWKGVTEDAIQNEQRETDM